MPYYDLILFYENQGLAFKKMVSYFPVYTVFTSIAKFLTLYIHLFCLQLCIDIHFLMLALVNAYYVYTYLSELLSSKVLFKFYNQDDSNEKSQ